MIVRAELALPWVGITQGRRVPLPRCRADRGERGDHGLSPDVMRDWDLFVSAGINDEEPPQFGEPGLFPPVARDRSRAAEQAPTKGSSRGAPALLHCPVERS